MPLRRKTILSAALGAVVTVLLDELYVKPLGAAPSPRAAEVPEREEPTQASRSS